MKISVVVPAYNEEKLIASSLRSMQKACRVMTARGWESEVIVCNNNSTDRTAEVAQAEGARVVFEPINQISRARNAGAAAAQGDWLVFIDADSYPSPELFEDMAEAMAGGRIVAGGATVRMEGNYAVGNFLVKFWNLISRTLKWAPGSCIFCRRDVFVKVGGFSAELYASEEVDLFVRLKREARRNGKKIRILSRHPIITSARKMHLYSKGEMLRFFLGTFWKPWSKLRSPKACFFWYDGRR